MKNDSQVGRILTERRRSNAAGFHQKSRDRHNETRLAIEEELELEADMSVIHPGSDFENYEDPYGDETDDGIVIVIPPHLIPIAKGEDYVPTGDNDASRDD